MQMMGVIWRILEMEINHPERPGKVADYIGNTNFDVDLQMHGEGLWQPWPPLANLIREMTLPGPPTKLRGFLLGSYFLCADVLTNKKNSHAVMVTSTDRGARRFLRELPVRRQTGGHAHGYCRLAE